MNRIILFLIISLCCCGPWITADGQNPRPDTTEVLKQLLALPAPRPPSVEQEEEPTRERPESFYHIDKSPPDDAPIEDLLDYWIRRSDDYNRPPSETVVRRLLEACRDDPRQLGELLDVLPKTEATKVKEIYDKTQNDEELEEYQRDQIKDWLVFNSTFFLNELFALASKAKEDEKYHSVDNKEAVVSLAKLNWEAAEPLLRRLAGSGQRRSSALAQSLFYEHAIDEKNAAAEERYRKILKTIASDRLQPAYARDIAIQTLSLTEWPGRDDWYLALFEDETLIDPIDGNTAFSSITTLFYSDPDKWIPIMARLVESKNVTVRSLAARCLLSFASESPRRDALLPLLPWLSDPTWVKDNFNTRLRLIQSMADLDVPESVPGLIWVVENEDSDSERSYAAHSLAKYKDPRAVPALKKALNKEKGEDHRKRIIESLLACQGLSEDEQLKALEAYSAKLTTPEGRVELDHYVQENPLPVNISIGKYLRELTVAPDSLIQAVLNRAENLKSENPALAKALLEVVHGWEGRQIDLDMITRIGNGSADANTIIQALQRRDKLRETLSPELHGLIAGSGAAQGIGAVLLDNQSMAQSVLGSNDQIAQIALLACSRLTFTELPVDLVGPLLRSQNSLLAQAAQSYLLIEDSEQARDLLWKHHPNKAFVTGWGENGEFMLGTFDGFKKPEEKLKAELFKEDGPVEIIALIAGSDSETRVLRIFANKAVYTNYEDPARYRERTVSTAELASFKQFLTGENFPDLGPQFGYCHHNCYPEEFLTLTKEKGRRVFAEQSWDVWSKLRDNFDRLVEGNGAKLHYNLEKEIKGVEILYTEKEWVVKDVWQQGSEIRIYVEHFPADENKAQQPPPESDSDAEIEVSNTERFRQTLAQKKARFSWRVYSNNKAATVTTQPDIYESLDESRFIPGDDDQSSLLDYGSEVQKLTADSVIIARNYEGLWKQTAGTKAVRVSGEGGAYYNPIATPDGKWVVVAKTDTDWSKPNYIVRFNSQTGREHRVNLEVADELFPIAFVAPHGKVLVSRAKDDSNTYSTKPVGPDRPEYYLLDPASGETRLVSGEFAPLRERGRRFLQPTGKPNEFWAAIPSEEKTQVGRYNLKDFSFKPVLVLPHISFGSMAMWVDEAQKKVYVVYKDQLLRLPLP